MRRLGALGFATVIAFLAMGCRSSDSGLLRVDVKGVVIDPKTQSPVLFLFDSESNRGLPVWIGLSEARAITLGLQEVTPPRPLTHDLMKNVMELLDVKLERVVITDLRDNTYYAVLDLRSGRRTWEVDSRPSDAVALALKFHAPLYLSPQLIEKGVLVNLGSVPEEAAIEEELGFALQDLSPGVARYFGFKGREGAIVTETTPGGPAERAGLRKGDILMRVDKKEIGSTEDARVALSENERSGSIRCDVYREGKIVSVKIKR